MQIIDWLVANGAVLFESLGILAFALSGLLVAFEKRLDLVGVAFVAAFTAFGGGTLRDVLLDRRPFFWVQNQGWVYFILALCLIAVFFLRQSVVGFTAKAILVPDAIGLGIFSAGGTQIALVAGMPALIAVLMGVFTAVMGGVLRDLSVREIPRAFTDHQPYSVIAFTGCWLVVLGDYLGWNESISVYLAAAVIVLVRLLAVFRGWRLPAWRN
ncbi:MAG: trimeric intracellular cation channel family protein [Micrococcales bacterium]